MVEIIIILLIIMSAATLAIQTTESELALRIKIFLGLSQPYPKKLIALSKFKTWWAFSPRLVVLLFPIVIFIVLSMKAHHFLSDLLDCAYCTSFHYTWTLLYFFIGMPLGLSLVLAPLGILFTYIIESIRYQKQ